MNGYYAASVSSSPILRPGANSHYPKYYPHSQSVPPPPQQTTSSLYLNSTRSKSSPNAYRILQYPPNVTFVPESSYPNASGILRTSSRNRAPNPRERERSATGTRYLHSQSESRKRVSFADGTKPGSPDDRYDGHPRLHMGRHRSTSSLSGKGLPSSRSKRHASRIADHHYDLGVPADPNANVRKFIPFLPAPPASHYFRQCRDCNDRNPHSRRDHKLYVDRRNSRQSKHSRLQRRPH